MNLFLARDKKIRGKVDIVIGGQYGSEGKGKVISYLSKEYDICIRTGGPNAGHTVLINGKKYKLRCLPSCFLNKKTLLLIGPGAVIDPEIFLNEINLLDIEKNRVFIDYRAGIIEKRHKQEESEIRKTIGSTGQGVGAALINRIRRDGTFKLVKDFNKLSEFLTDTVELVNKGVNKGKRVLVEGTQGFGLSLFHGKYPYVTSRDTTAQAFLSECGISPKLVDQIFLVIRSYPIRVAGNSGPLYKEISWKVVTNESGSTSPIIEKTTVTQKVRRVGRFNMKLIKQAVMVNRPTQIALNFIDYVSSKDRGKRKYEDLTEKSQKFIKEIEKETNVPVTLIGTGPDTYDIIDRRKDITNV